MEMVSRALLWATLLWASPLLALQLGDKVPDFTLPSTEGPFTLSEQGADHWVLLVSHPAAFTPICTTELAALAQEREWFAERGVKLAAIAVGDAETLARWRADISKLAGKSVGYPLLADGERQVSEQLGMLHPKALDTHTVRSVLIIDRRQRLRLRIDYPPDIGRNVDEIKRVTEALLRSERYHLMAPVNWVPGTDMVVPGWMQSEQAKELFGTLSEGAVPYLRYTPDPDRR
ncbi:redoxin domain-containing protein [Isoalcanivorax beigongshangi]|uniref:Thioredoxin peroxidase n=1 Tax=Isoalcanivorax beigongshangi TaxID=3238810 RepID=A0ABV4AKE3_9GAMM